MRGKGGRERLLLVRGQVREEREWLRGIERGRSHWAHMKEGRSRRSR